MDVGARVRRARVEHGVSQAQLAIRAGTTQTAISRLENGGVSPTVDTLERVLRCLGLQLALAVEPLPSWAEDADLAAAARMNPDQRIDHAIQSMRSLAGLHGAAGRG